MKPLLLVWTAWLATSCGGLLKPQSTSEVGIDAGTDSSIDIASDLAQDVAATDVAIETFETCALSDGGEVRVPANHRATAVACPTTRGPTTPIDSCSPNAECLCLSDADCTAGHNGRCINDGASGTWCSYDECFTDADCTNGGTCNCRTSDSDWDGNSCIAGNCRTDSDCGPCGFCSLSAPCVTGSDFADGYYCHTPQDRCTDDSDCAPLYCAFDTINQSWMCVKECLPIP